MGQVVRLHQGTDVQADGQAGVQSDGRLTDLLRALATARPCPDEPLRQDGITDIPRRIAATVLPREVRVMVQSREVLRLLIANRRLLRVTAAGGDDHAPEPSDPEAAANAFAASLRRHFPDGALTLRVARPAAETEMPDLGCDSDQLSRALGVSAPARPETAMGFDVRMQALAVVWLRQHRDGHVLARGGDADMAVLDAVMARADWPAVPKAGQCLLMPGPAEMDLSVTTDADERLICLSPASARARLYAAWATCH